MMVMQQDYVCLQTLKDLDEIEKSVKKLGMEVIFKCKRAYVNPEDLTKEEKNPWIGGIEESVNRNLENGAMFSKTLEDLAQTGRRHASEVLAILNRYKENPSKEILDSLFSMYLIASRHAKNYDLLHPSLTSMLELIANPGVPIPSSVSVSCLIAKKGENVVRYIGILDNKDPIVTIMGPDAEVLNVSLEANLG